MYEIIQKNCFNGAKSWQLGWYNEKAVEIQNPSTIIRGSIYLSFFGEYPLVPSNSQTDVVLLKVGDYHVIYNLKQGINHETGRQFANAVTITYQAANDEMSRNDAALKQSGDSFIMPETYLTIEFCEAVVNNATGVHQVKLSLYRTGSSSCGSQFDMYLNPELQLSGTSPTVVTTPVPTTFAPTTAEPTGKPTPEPTRHPTFSPTGLPTARPTFVPTPLPTDVPFEPTPSPIHNIFDNDNCHYCSDIPDRYSMAHPFCWRAYELHTKCNGDPYWAANRICQRTCYFLGRGYEGDKCCRIITPTLTTTTTAKPTSEPTQQPIPLPTPSPTARRASYTPTSASCSDDEMEIQIEIDTGAVPSDEIEWLLKEEDVGQRGEKFILYQQEQGYPALGTYWHSHCVRFDRSYKFQLTCSSYAAAEGGEYIIFVNGERYERSTLKRMAVITILPPNYCGENHNKWRFRLETGNHPDKVNWSIVKERPLTPLYNEGPWDGFQGDSLYFSSASCLNINECYSMTIYSMNKDSETGEHLGLSGDDGGGYYLLKFNDDNVAWSTFSEGFSGTARFGDCPEIVFPKLCFSGNSLVERDDGNSIRMADLQIGDKVLTQDGRYEPIYSFAHLHATQWAEFVQLQTNKSTTLELTSDHMIWVSSNEYVPASLVQVGTMLSNREVIVQKRTVQKKGVYAPLTRSGTIVVNGILCSTYITLQPDSPYLRIGSYLTLPISWQWLEWNEEQIWQTLFRRGSNQKMPESYTLEGISMRGARGLQMVQWILSQHVVVQIVLWIPIVLLFLILSQSKTALLLMLILGAILQHRRRDWARRKILLMGSER